MYSVYSFYEFSSLKDLPDLKKQLVSFHGGADILGTILIASEGINGTISGPKKAIDAFIESIRSLPGILLPTIKISEDASHAFKRFKVKIKNEIVTLGKGQMDVYKNTGTVVEPDQWNELIKQPDILLIDTRNEYECNIGQFKGSINPKTQSFREFPEVIEDHLKLDRDQRLAMYCTGGIRCEKASSYMLKLGFKEVYQLKGGILNYLKSTPPEASLWQGECFVFDERVSVNESLKKGTYDMCHACRSPISDQDKNSAHYIKGVSCPNCYDMTSQERKLRFAEREKQFELRKQRSM